MLPHDESVKDALSPPEADAVGLPERIGPYRILGLLGTGGMGAVYRAQQESPRREVALKIVRAGLTQPDALRRFRLEAQVLGQLEHPGIARIYEAGTSETSEVPQPWFAMEFVRGLPLLDFAERHGLDRRQRLVLLARVCDAVQHAHSKGVIHRDLKPANVLVAEGAASHETTESGSGADARVSASGQPKVLDFGVARVTGSDLNATTVRTDVGQLVGTVPYMSPEQVRGLPDDIDARSDVYALGVLAHELLSGTRPYDLQGKSVPEALRIIEEEDALPLSTFDRSLRGDVDTIVRKALEKEKSRRYATAADLADDIRRHLRDEPILGRPPSTLYQLGKFARRNRGLVAGVAVAFLLLVAGTVASLTQAALARRAADKHAHVVRVLGDMLGGVTPEMAATLDKTLMLRILSDTAERVDSGTIGDPEVELEVRSLLAHTYLRLRETELLRDELEALAALGAEVGTSRERELEMDRWRAALLRYEGRHAEAVSAGSAALEAHRASLGERAEQTLRCASDLGVSMLELGQTAAAVEFLEEQRALAAQALGEDHPVTLGMVSSLATGHYYSGEYEESLELFRRVYEGRLDSYGPDHPTCINDLGGYAMALGQVRQFDLAQEKYAEVLTRAEAVFGPDHQTTLKLRNNYAGMLSMKGDGEGSLRLFEAVARDRARVLGHQHPLTLYTMRNVAKEKGRLGRIEEAEAAHREVLALRRAELGGAHRDTGQSYTDLALLAHQRGEMAEAAEWFGRAAESFLAVAGETDPAVAFRFYRWAAVAQDSGDQARAEEIYRRALSLHAEYDGEDRNWLGACINGLAKACAELGRHDEAERSFREGVLVRERVHGEGSVDATYSYADLADYLHERGRYDEGVEWARRAVAAREEHLGAAHASTVNARATLATGLAGAGALEEARRELLAVWEREREREPGHARRVWVLERLVELHEELEDPAGLAEFRAQLEAESSE